MPAILSLHSTKSNGCSDDNRAASACEEANRHWPQIKTGSPFSILTPCVAGALPNPSETMIVVSSIVVIIVELFNFYDNSHFIPSNDSFVMNGEVVR